MHPVIMRSTPQACPGIRPAAAAAGHGAARAGAGGVVRADRQHIAHPALADAPAQLTAAVHLVSCHEGGADPRDCAWSSRSLASCGLAANGTFSGIPASSRCYSSAAHPRAGT